MLSSANPSFRTGISEAEWASPIQAVAHNTAVSTHRLHHALCVLPSRPRIRIWAVRRVRI
jgi:hypothetical protein